MLPRRKAVPLPLWVLGDDNALILVRLHLASAPVDGSGFGCAFSHSAWVTSFTLCLKTKTPFLLPTTTSGYLGLLTYPVVTCVPTPESSSIRQGINSAWPLAGRTSLNQ